jgi:hypothetical protein
VNALRDGIRLSKGAGRGGPLRRRRRVVAGTAFDALGLALAPSTRHKLEHDEFLELDRQEEGDAAPPRSRVDLDAGTARIVVPQPH